MERPGISGLGRRERSDPAPTAIRRVAVIEVIAILCPVRPAVLALYAVLFLPITRRSFFRVHCLGRSVAGFYEIA